MHITHALTGSTLPRRILTALLGLVAALGLLLATVTAGHASADLMAQPADLTAEPVESDFGCGMRMNSTATYFGGDSRIVGHTEQRNNCQLLGFHASVVPVLVDAQDRMVAYGSPKRYGIDMRGPCVPWGCPPTQVRNEYWEDHIDPAKAATATRLVLQQFRSPNSILESLQAFNAHAEEALRTAKTAAQFYALIAAAG
jgi:hypothetical protein